MQVMIDNERYVKASENIKQTIGIGITTHNRNSLVQSTVDRIKAHTPDARIVVVDDASRRAVVIDGVEVYRFQHNVGIARAKNKCLELLSDCDHIFLFDDDTYPLQDNWFLPYIESPEHHMMYLFESWANGKPVGDDSVIYKDNKIVAHTHARGCMMYVDSIALATVGGFDVRYGKAMNEHLDWSNRIYNAGLTTFKHVDVLGSEDLIYSMDQHQQVQSSIELRDRRKNLTVNNELLKQNETSAEFMPYGSDVVIACYFANAHDVQRNKQWAVDYEPIKKLEKSLKAHGVEFVLIHNCFDLPNRVDINTTPYFERWLKEWQYLRDRRDINNVFVVDATDVDMLNNPFNSMDPNVLYIGDEPGKVISDPWMLSMHRESSVNQYLRENKDFPLLNCGVVGGPRKLVMDVCKSMYTYHFENPQDQTEMGIFNKLMYTKYRDHIDFGRHVTTVFKKFEVRSNAWFRHK